MNAATAIQISDVSVTVREARIMFERALSTCGLPASHVNGIAELLFGLELATGLGVGQVFPGGTAIDLIDAVPGTPIVIQRSAPGVISIDAQNRSAFAVGGEILDAGMAEVEKAGFAYIVVTDITSPLVLAGIPVIAAEQGVASTVSAVDDSCFLSVTKPSAITQAQVFGGEHSAAGIEAGHVTISMWRVESMSALVDPRGGFELTRAYTNGIHMPAEKWWQLYYRANELLSPASAESRLDAGPPPGEE